MRTQEIAGDRVIRSTAQMTRTEARKFLVTLLDITTPEEAAELEAWLDLAKISFTARTHSSYPGVGINYEGADRRYDIHLVLSTQQNAGDRAYGRGTF
jgi:hypothetical protein